MPLGSVNNEDFEAEVNNSANVYIPPVTKPRPTVVNPDAMRPVNENQDELGPIVTSDAVVKRFHPHGRNEGDVNVPQSLRKLIGDTSTFEGRKSALALANGLGISSSSVSTYANPDNGALSEKNSEDIFAHLANRKTKMSKKALNKLSLALSFIDEGKLKDLGARDLAAVSKDMAQVAKHMEPKQESDKQIDPVQFHFYAPQVRNENHYETVVAKDNY